MFKKTAAALAALLCCSAAWAYSPDQPELQVGTSSTYPPYEFLNTDGNLAGFDIDLMEAIGDKMGKKIVWTDTGSFDMLIPAIITEKLELIISGISATEERAKRVLFSDIYEKSTGAFITALDSDIKGLEDLKGKVAAVQLGTIQDSFLRKIQGEYGFELKTFPRFEECVWEIVLGRADFTFMSAVAAQKFMEHKDFTGKIQTPFYHELDGQGCAIAMKLGETQLKADVDAALAELVADGTLDSLKAKWGLDFMAQ